MVAYILVARKSKNDNRKAAQGRNRASPMDDANWASISHCIPLDKMVNYQDDQVGHGDQRCNASILEGVQSAQVGKRDDDQPIESRRLAQRPSSANT